MVLIMNFGLFFFMMFLCILILIWDSILVEVFCFYDISKNFFKEELSCLFFNYYVCNILVDFFFSNVYFVIMSSDSDLFIDVRDLWISIKLNYFKFMCIVSVFFVVYMICLSEKNKIDGN